MRFSLNVPRLEAAQRLNSHRLTMLVRLRWAALLGVSLALILATLLQFDGLAWTAMAIFVGAGVLYNILLSGHNLVSTARFQRIYVLQLVLDISALSGLLWASGGLDNPFSSLFMVHVVVAALIGSFGAVILAGGMASMAAITLHFLNLFGLLAGRWSPPEGFQDSARLAALLVTAVSIAAVEATLSWRFQVREASLTEAREAVRLREQVLERVLNGLSAAVEVVRSQQIVWQNEAMSQIRPLAIGDGWICPGRLLGCNRASQSEEGSCTEHQHDPTSCLISVQREDGPKVYRKYVWHVQSGQPNEMVHLYVDETRRITEDERLKLTERLASLGRMAQGLAHELNTPLATVRTLARDVLAALQDSPAIPDSLKLDVDDSLNLALKELDRCGRITRGLLSGRGLQGPARPEFQPLAPIVRDAVTLVSVGSRRRCQFEVAQGDVNAFVDPDLLTQVLVNLLSNAVDASPQGSTIDIVAETQGNEIRLEVLDRGCGLAPAIKGRLFEPFATTKPVGQGTGLGLYMVRLLLNELGGGLELLDRPGGGTIARVTLQQRSPGFAV